MAGGVGGRGLECMVFPGYNLDRVERIQGPFLSELNSLSINVLRKRLHRVVSDVPRIDLPQPRPRLPGRNLWTYAHRVQFYEYIDEWATKFSGFNTLTKDESDRLNNIRESPCFEMFYMEHDPSPALKRNGRLHLGITRSHMDRKGFKAFEFSVLDRHSKTITKFRMYKDRGVEVVGDRHRSAAGDWFWIDGVYVFV